MKTQIEIIPVKNTFLIAGDILRMLQENNVERDIIKRIERRFLGVFERYPLYQHINIINKFGEIIKDTTSFMLINKFDQNGFHGKDLRLYEREIEKIENGLNK